MGYKVVVAGATGMAPLRSPLQARAITFQLQAGAVQQTRLVHQLAALGIEFLPAAVLYPGVQRQVRSAALCRLRRRG